MTSEGAAATPSKGRTIPAGTRARTESRFWILRVESPRGVALLETASLAYVALPLLIFVCGWLRLPFALILVPAVILALAHGARSAIAWARNEYQKAELADASMADNDLVLRAVLLVGIVVFLVICTGVGGFTFRFRDYVDYDAQLRTLIDYPWPVGSYTNFAGPDVRMPGVQYWAYFLPVALVGRIVGWNVAYPFNCFWNIVGVLLAVVWFLRLVGTFRLRFAVMFLLFGGVDLIGYLVTTPLPGTVDTTWWDYVTGTFWWSTGRGWMAHWSANFSLLTPDGQTLMGGVFYRFYGMLWFLCDGPHHVLPVWVLLFIVLHDALRRRTVERLFLLTSFLPLCSPFVTLGTIPLLVISVVHTRAKRMVTVGNIVVGPAVVLMFLLWYRTVENAFIHGGLWHFQDLGRTWHYLLLYYASAFGLYVVVAPSMRGNGYRPGRLWFYTAVAVFLFAPWYRLGVYNDFTTKIVIPSQLIFLVCLATALRAPSGWKARVRQRLLIGVLAIASWAALGIVYRAIEFGFSFNPPPLERALYLAEKVERFNRTDEILILHPDNFFWNHLAKPVTYFRVPEDPSVRIYDFAHPHDAVEWKRFTDESRITDAGLVLTTEGNKPLARSDEFIVDTRTIGSIQLEHSVVDEDGKTPEYSIVFLWASEDDIRKLGGWWPFHNWRSNVIYPPHDPVSSNSYWRGKTKHAALFFKVDGPPDKKYTVTLRRLIFLQR